MCTVSVIVPVYNKEQYLRECLDSLLKQTLRDIEIICIDDRSTDGSAKIISECAAKDSRILVISQTHNQGVSAARNKGIQTAHGEFIAFVDADDFVDSDFFEKLVMAAPGYECVKGEVWDYDAGQNRCSLNTNCDVNDDIKKTGNPMYFGYGFTSAIYRREWVVQNGIHFPEGISYFEDSFFTLTLAAGLSAVKVVDGAKYYYRNVAMSLSRDLTPDRINDLFRSISELFACLGQCRLSEESKYIVARQVFNATCNFYTSVSEEQLHRLREDYTAFLGKRHADGKICVSVIVPVYNGEKYLRRTLDCLTVQSLGAIEIICVNDCSTDGSLAILNEYQSQDDRVRVIDCSENGGESRARNIGIRAAVGEYIAFMDQDDLLDLYFYERLYSKATETGADIVKGDAVEYLYSGQKWVRRPYAVESNPLYFSGDWWTAIYRRTLIRENHIELPEGYPLGGDLKFLFDACMACNKVAAIHDAAYYHIMHQDSGDSEITPLHKLKSALAIFAYILGKIEESGLFERDRNCYLFYYFSYILHAYERIKRCPETEGKLLCSDFAFKWYDICRCKNEVLKKLQMTAPLLSDVLAGGKKAFFEQMLARDALSDVFYENRDSAKEPASATCVVVVPFIAKEVAEKYIVQNAFLKREKKLTCRLVDNREKNRPISVVYNEFLNGYDYSQDAWFILMHSDFEFLTFPSDVLSRLDPSVIYGPVGARAYFNKGKMFVSQKGSVYEKTDDNTLYQNFVYQHRDMGVDTLDCMCLMVHSSLVRKYGLRFDENTLFDLYAEDFCISANRDHGIPVEAVRFDCAHHSSYAKVKYISQRYLKQLEYINQKYPDSVYGGTVTPVGKKILPAMTDNEFYAFLIRQELLTGKKL